MFCLSVFLFVSPAKMTWSKCHLGWGLTRGAQRTMYCVGSRYPRRWGNFCGCPTHRSANVALNNSFRKVFNSFWRESVKPLLMYCWCLPVSVLIHQRRLLFWKKCASSDNSVLRTLALCCRDAVSAVCDLYKLSTHDLVVFPVYIVKQLIWDCFRRTVHT